MWENLNPNYGPVTNTFKSKVRRLAKKIWRRVKIYLEHDEYRMLNQLSRYNNEIITVGDLTYGHPDTNSPRIVYFGEKTKLEIGKFCSIAENVTIFIGGYHNTEFVTTYPFSTAYSDVPYSDILIHKPKTIIGNDVWIGANATIMAGVKIGHGAIIATNSVVVKDVGDYEIVGGNPAKLIKYRFSEKHILQLKKINWWDWPIDKIKKEVFLLQSSKVEDFIKKHLNEDI